MLKEKSIGVCIGKVVEKNAPIKYCEIIEDKFEGMSDEEELN